MKVAKGSAYAWFICIIGAAFYGYEYVLRVVPSVMTHQLMDFFSIGPAAFGVLAAFYYYAYTPMQLPVGVVLDHFGPRRVIALASLLCVLGSYLFGLTDNYWIAASGRFLIGAGSAFGFVGSLKIASIWLPDDRFALMAGVTMMSGMIGAMIADIVLSHMLTLYPWKTVVSISGHVGLILTILIYSLVRDNPEKVVEKVSEPIPWKDLGLQILRFLRVKNVWFCGAVGAALYLSLDVIAELWGIQYLQQAHHLSHASASHANSFIFFGWALGAPLMGWFSDKIKRRVLPLLFSCISSAILICVLLYAPHLSETTIFALLFFIGISGTGEILVFALGRELCGDRYAGTALAVINMLIMFVGAVLQPMVGWVLATVGDQSHLIKQTVFSATDYRYALTVVPILFVGAAVVTFFMTESHCKVKPS